MYLAILILGFALLMQTFKVWKTNDYIVMLENLPTATIAPTYTPMPTYTPVPQRIVIATITNETAIQSIATVAPTYTPIVVPTITPIIILTDTIKYAETKPTTNYDNNIPTPVYNFGNGASTTPPRITVTQSFISSQELGDVDMSYLYQYIISLLSQLGVLQLLSANVQLIIIVGISFLLLSLFIR